MSLYIEEKYLKMLGPRLQGLKQQDKHRWNCRCPLCGDSKKQNKRRGYFFAKAGKLMYFCHNCGASKLFRTFLKEFDSNLFSQYSLEIFKEKMSNSIKSELPVVTAPPTVKYIPDIFEDLPLIRNMDENSQVYIYCETRKLPVDDFDFHYAEKFIEWTKGNTEKFINWKDSDHSRIVIPWRDRNQKIIGYSARSLGPEEPKYYRIFIDEEVKEHLFGLDRIDESKQIYVVEGEIDSLMIPNAIAVANGKLHKYINKNAIYIPDRDVRNKHIMRGVSEMVELGLKVCFLPLNLPKDLNDMKKANMTTGEILSIINSNTYQGLEAKLQFSKWSNVN